MSYSRVIFTSKRVKAYTDEFIASPLALSQVKFNSAIEDSIMSAVDNNSIVVVCAADDKFAMPLTVMARSVIANLKSTQKLALFILDNGIKEHNKRRIIRSLNSEQSEIKWISMSDILPKELPMGKYSSSYISTTTYCRIFIPDLLPNDLDKAIYLDSDLIVNEELEKLWDIDIGENYLLAVQDINVPFLSSHIGIERCKELGISLDSKCLNAGVLVINLRKWRTTNMSKKVIDYIVQNSESIVWNDQDGLNIVLAGKWGELDPRWNQQTSIHDFSSWKDSPFSEEVYNNAVHHPYIIHFTTPYKPWTSLREHPSKHLFFQYLDMTAWSGWRLTIWRRAQRRIAREIKQLKNVVSLPNTQVQNRKT